MAASISPVVGDWYTMPGGQQFEVVAIDEEDGVVAIQYFDGELDEIELDAWAESGIFASPPPEDWTGAYEDLERDDLGYTDMNMRPDGHQPFMVEDLDPDE